jgi:hypothetical protein
MLNRLDGWYIWGTRSCRLFMGYFGDGGGPYLGYEWGGGEGEGGEEIE